MHLCRCPTTFLFAFLFAYLLAFSSGASAQTQAFPPGAEAREARLLAQLTPSVRDWITSEGRRQASSASPQAVAAVKARFPGLSQGDIADMVLLLFMEISRDARKDMRGLLTDMQAVNHSKEAMREDTVRRREDAAVGGGRPAALGSTRTASTPPQAPLVTPIATTRQKDPPGDLGEVDQLRLQQYTERDTNAMEALSNLMKRTSDTASNILKNLE